MGGERRKTSGGKGRGVEEDSPLHVAARAGDIVAVRTICSSNPLSVNARDRHSRTPLHLAAWSGHLEVVSYLCSHKADPGAAAMDDMGAIHFAAQKGHTNVVRALLSSGASVRAANRKGWTPLHYAVKGSHLDLAKYLIRKGANLDAKTRAGETPLDLGGGDEYRATLSECERKLQQSHKEEGAAAGKKAGDERTADDGKRKASAELPVEGGGEGKKAREVGAGQDASVPKKPRVVLSHLIEEEDMEQEQER
ncbi:unnamed protein product [Spirodela intermedia]|uniref:Uncharacterized protein n=1 Tax=Spirodela intermedia TaxID=51605 RepID=A0A7I8L1L3_SPIIN|nr:unnamed protein product [Spirodela intermedia]